MRCGQCGQEFPFEMKFCPECGAKQEAVPETESVAWQESQEADQEEKPEAADVTVMPAGEGQTDEQAAGEPAESRQEQEALHARRLAYVREDYDPLRHGRLQPAPVPAAAMSGTPGPAAATRPSSTGMVIFSIINMLCCGLGISLVLGIIALIYAIMASSETSFEQAQKKLATARILNLVGLFFIILQVILFFSIIAAGVLFSS